MRQEHFNDFVEPNEIRQERYSNLRLIELIEFCLSTGDIRSASKAWSV